MHRFCVNCCDLKMMTPLWVHKYLWKCFLEVYQTPISIDHTSEVHRRETPTIVLQETEQNISRCFRTTSDTSYSTHLRDWTYTLKFLCFLFNLSKTRNCGENLRRDTWVCFWSEFGLRKLKRNWTKMSTEAKMLYINLYLCFVYGTVSFKDWIHWDCDSSSQIWVLLESSVSFGWQFFEKWGCFGFLRIRSTVTLLLLSFESRMAVNPVASN